AHRTGAVVADEEDRSAALVGVVVLDEGAGDAQREQVAIVVDGPAAAAARGAAAGRVGAPADRVVERHDAVEHHPRHLDAAQRANVGAGTALSAGAAAGAAH